MREIFFRGKYIDNNELVYGYIVRYEDTWDIYKDSIDLLYWVDSDTVGQYTGLTDVNGNKIFEGDIVKLFNGNKYYIDYSEVMASFRMCNKKHASLEIRRPLTLIGNIYDNPELMEVEEEDAT